MSIAPGARCLSGAGGDLLGSAGETGDLASHAADCTGSGVPGLELPANRTLAPWRTTSRSGIVPTEGRGSLPYALVHGESLVAAASWALTTAGVELFDYSVPFEAVQDAESALVLHDPLAR